MSVLCAFLITCLIGTFEARQPDIDINRVKLLPRRTSHLDDRPILHARRSLNDVYQISRNNDYDDHSSGVVQSYWPVHVLPDASTFKDAEAIKVHQPREDPRIFYQSDEYLKKMARNELNKEVSFVYPGRDVIHVKQNSPSSVHFTHLNYIDDDIANPNMCVKCPRDRTMISKPGSHRVVLQHPRLQSCSPGQKLPKNIRFVHMYGPNFGYLLEEGSHVVVGKIMLKNKPLQICKMQIHVISQSCPTPKSLIVHCENGNDNCTFTCRETKQELHGEAKLSCQNNKWSGNLPICKDRTWCEPPPPPDHGRLTCKGSTTRSGAGLLAGSTCRARCDRGWRWSPRATAVCRRGAWTHSLLCQPKRN